MRPGSTCQAMAHIKRIVFITPTPAASVSTAAVAAMRNATGWTCPPTPRHLLPGKHSARRSEPDRRARFTPSATAPTAVTMKRRRGAGTEEAVGEASSEYPSGESPVALVGLVGDSHQRVAFMPLQRLECPLAAPAWSMSSPERSSRRRRWTVLRSPARSRRRWRPIASAGNRAAHGYFRRLGRRCPLGQRPTR